MQKTVYFFVILFSFASCYTYKVKKPAELPVENAQNNKKVLSDADIEAAQMKEAADDEEAKRAKQEKMQKQKAENVTTSVVAPINVQEKLEPNKKYQIEVGDKSYKILVDRWEKDSLVAHPVSKPKEVIKFHKNQINPDQIGERRFSQPVADILTVFAYASIGFGIYMLLR